MHHRRLFAKALSFTSLASFTLKSTGTLVFFCSPFVLLPRLGFFLHHYNSQCNPALDNSGTLAQHLQCPKMVSTSLTLRRYTSTTQTYQTSRAISLVIKRSVGVSKICRGPPPVAARRRIQPIMSMSRRTGGRSGVFG